MPRRWIIRPQAEGDLESAARWYEQQRTGLGLQVLEALDRLFDRVRATPLQFPQVLGGLRRALVHTFPYAVYFEVADDAGVVHAVLHLRRRPETLDQG